MKWKIDYSKTVVKFIKKHSIKMDVSNEIRKFLLKLVKNEDVNVDFKKLDGLWKGYYRLRKGKLRIIFSLDNIKHSLFVEKIDYRGDVYK